MAHYTSLEHLRADKVRARRTLGKTVKRVKADLTNTFTPQSNILTGSSSRALNFIGYTIAAYKTARSVRSLFSFISKIL